MNAPLGVVQFHTRAKTGKFHLEVGSSEHPITLKKAVRQRVMLFTYVAHLTSRKKTKVMLVGLSKATNLIEVMVVTIIASTAQVLIEI